MQVTFLFSPGLKRRSLVINSQLLGCSRSSFACGALPRIAFGFRLQCFKQPFVCKTQMGANFHCSVVSLWTWVFNALLAFIMATYTGMSEGKTVRMRRLHFLCQWLEDNSNELENVLSVLFFFLNAVIASKINTPFLFASIYIGNAIVSFEILFLLSFLSFKWVRGPGPWTRRTLALY